MKCSLQDVLFQPCECCNMHRAEAERREQIEREAAQCPAHAQPRALLCPLCLNNLLAVAQQTARKNLLQEMLNKIPDGQGVPDAWLDILRPEGTAAPRLPHTEGAPTLPLIPCGEDHDACGNLHTETEGA